MIRPPSLEYHISSNLNAERMWNVKLPSFRLRSVQLLMVHVQPLLKGMRALLTIIQTLIKIIHCVHELLLLSLDLL